MIDLAPSLQSTSPFCLFAVITGKPCPTCGGTRAVIDILTGDITSALSNNLMVSSALFLGAVLIVGRSRKVVVWLRSPKPLQHALRLAADRIVQRPAVTGAVYALMWGWNIARWV